MTLDQSHSTKVHWR